MVQLPVPAGHRGANGRFLRGNPGGPGNPYARQAALLRGALHAALGPEDVEDVARAMIARAIDGDVAAAKLVLAYAVGKPQTPLDDVAEQEIMHRAGVDRLTDQELEQLLVLSLKVHGSPGGNGG